MHPFLEFLTNTEVFGKWTPLQIITSIVPLAFAIFKHIAFLEEKKKNEAMRVDLASMTKAFNQERHFRTKERAAYTSNQIIGLFIIQFIPEVETVNQDTLEQIYKNKYEENQVPEKYRTDIKLLVQEAESRSKDGEIDKKIAGQYVSVKINKFINENYSDKINKNPINKIKDNTSPIEEFLFNIIVIPAFIVFIFFIIIILFNHLSIL